MYVNVPVSSRWLVCLLPVTSHSVHLRLRCTHSDDCSEKDRSKNVALTVWWREDFQRSIKVQKVWGVAKYFERKCNEMKQIKLARCPENNKQSRNISWSSTESPGIPETWRRSWALAPSVTLTSAWDCACGPYFSNGKTKSEEQISFPTLDVPLRLLQY